MKLLKFKSGLNVNLEHVTGINVSGNVITFQMVNNPSTNPTATVYDPVGVMSQIDDFLNGNAYGIGSLIVNDSLDVVLTSVDNPQFAPGTDTIIITGSGFTPGMNTPVAGPNGGPSTQMYDNV